MNCPTCCIGLERSLVELGLLGSTRADPSAELDVSILPTYSEETSGGAGKGRGDGESGDGGGGPVDESNAVDCE